MHGKRQWLFGGLLVLLGVLLLSINLGYTTISLGWFIRRFWPVILILWGASFILDHKNTGEMITGLILAILGFLLLGNRMGWFAVNLSRLWTLFWPTILILIGVSILRGPRITGGRNMAFMSGIDKRKTAWDLEDDNYSAVLGGISLDLRKANLEAGREYHLNFNVFMGGIELTVPGDVTVYCEGSVTLGGLEMLGEETGGIFANLTAEQLSEHTDAPVIHIDSRVILGGVEIISR